MSLMRSLEGRAKFTYLLQLCSDELAALEQGDMAAFDRILVAKREVINGMTDAQSIIASDPSVMVLVERIRDADESALKLLQGRLSNIKVKLQRFNQSQTARRAYRRFPTPTLRNFGYAVHGSSARFIDRTF